METTTTQASSPTDKPNDKSDEIIITINRHTKLFELLNNSRKIWRAFCVLLILIIFLFVGIPLIILALKGPFDVKTLVMNQYGAVTTITKDTETTYWLFNSAELWANSGIEVNAGDRLTIRASGLNHSAIHHLASTAMENRRQAGNLQWSDANGREQAPEWNNQRMYFPIMRTKAPGMVLMQVFPHDSINDPTNQKRQKDIRNKYFDGQNSASDGRLYAIGKERNEILIHKSGVLHFAINDVVLTDANIESLYRKQLDALVAEKLIADSDKATALTLLDDTSAPERDIVRKADTADVINYPVDTAIYNLIVKVAQNKESKEFVNSSKGLKIKGYPLNVRVINKTDTLQTFEVPANSHPLFNELLYYKHTDYFDAWFADNLGSMLLVIERKRK